MLIRSIQQLNFLPPHDLLNPAEHLLFTGKLDQGAELPERVMGLAILTTLSGSMILSVNNQRVEVDAGSFMVVNHGSTLHTRLTKGSARPVFLLFKKVVAVVVAAEVFYQNELDTPVDHLEVLTQHHLVEHIHYTSASLRERLELLISMGSSCASFQALKTDAIVRAILNDLATENLQALAVSKALPAVKTSTKTDLYRRLKITRNFMDHHYHQVPDLDTLAAIAMMNREYFLRNFKLAFDITPHQYLMQKRMSWAKEQLTGGQEPIQSIAEQVGFETLSSFSYQFKKTTGLSPSQYRKAFG